MTFGDVPYWDAPVDETDLASMYKDRDPRSTVTDAIYNDLKYALENVRTNDGTMNINRYVVARCRFQHHAVRRNLAALP